MKFCTTIGIKAASLRSTYRKKERFLESTNKNRRTAAELAIARLTAT